MNEYERAFKNILVKNGSISSYKLLQELVERTVPKKVIIYEDGGYFECTNCSAKGDTDSAWLFTERGEYTYCPRCGHRLDWDV